MRKKIISILLAVSIILSCVPLVMADVSVYDSGNSAEKADVLFGLGVAAKPEAEQNLDEQKATVAQFVNMCMNLYTGGKIPEVTVQLPYDDVYTGHEYYAAISFAYSIGVIPDADKLNPDLPVDRQFALETAVNTLGFSYVNEYTSGYSKYFKKSELMDGVLNSDELSLNDCYNIAYNMLCMNSLDVETVFEDNGVPYVVVEKSETLAKKSYGLDIVSGRVTSTAFASVSGKAVGDEKVAIDGKVYNCSDSDFIDKIGLEVDAFADGKNIKYAVVTNGTDDVIEIKPSDFDSFNGTSVSYLKNNKIRKTTVKSPLIVYNGAEVSGTDYKKSLFDISEGSIRLIRNGGTYDVINITDYKSFVVKSVYTDNTGVSSVSADNIDKYVVKFDPSKHLALKNSGGIEMSAKDIKAGQLVTYAASLDGNCVNAIVSDGGFYADEFAINCNSGGKIHSVVLDGIEYNVNSQVNEGNVKIDINNEYVWYLTPFGNIGAVKYLTSENDKLAYMWGADNGSGLKNDLKFRFVDNTNYDANNALVVNAADRICIDGVSVKKADALSKIKLFNGTADLPVIYRTNAKGEVNYIDTPTYNPGYENSNSLMKRSVPDRDLLNGVYAKEDNRYKNEFSNMYIVPFDGIVVINDGSEAYTVNALKGDMRYDADKIGVFSRGSDSYVADIVTYVGASGTTSSAKLKNIYYIVGRQYRSVDEYGEDVQKIVLNNSGKDETYVLSQKYPLPQVDTGDVIRIGLDPRNKIEAIDITLAFKNSNADTGFASSEEYNTERRAVFGKVVNVEYNESIAKYIVSYYIKDPSDVETVFIDGASIKEVDVQRGELSIGSVSADNIRSYKDYAEAADNVLVCSTWTIANYVYLFRN